MADFNDDNDIFGEDISEPVIQQEIIATPLPMMQKGTQFEQALERLKSRNKKKSIEITPDMAQAFCTEIVSHMNAAAESDERSVAEGEPPTARLQLLDAVCAELGKKKLSEHFMTNGAGNAIARWLAPDARGQLPPLTIRAKLVDVIENMELETDIVTNAHLGKTMLSLWRSETDLTVRQKCANICLKWLNDVLSDDQSRQAHSKVNQHAAVVSAAIRREADTTKEKRTYVVAPARTYIKAPDSGYKGDAGASLNIKISKRLRDMRRK